MKSLRDLLAQQGDLEHCYPAFVSSLDAERTVTLHELLTRPESLARLEAPWLDANIVHARFEALGRFMERVGGLSRMRNNCRLIFFQAQPGDEDAAHHAQLVQDSSFYAKRYGFLPPQFAYLHTPNRWLDMSGTLASGNRRLKPMSNYASHSYKEVMVEEPQTLEEAEAAADLAFGYAVPNWPEILQVSNATATDYFLRPVLHDIGHQLLPSLNPDIDSLHNAVMLYAMGGVDATHESLWETMVHRECTDPISMCTANTCFANVSSLISTSYSYTSFIN